MSLLDEDREDLPALLRLALDQAQQVLGTLDERPVAVPLPASFTPAPLPERGLGARGALNRFNARHEPLLGGSAGPRYLGFVTGGTTPAALLGDWLTGTYDQNVSSTEGSAAALVDAEAIAMLRDLFGLPASFHGVFVTGATMANFVGLATARQWAGERVGRDVAEQGLDGVPLRVLAATPHASAIKALAMLGMGRGACERVATLPDREAVDPAALTVALARDPGRPTIVLASAATVNTCDFDPLVEVAAACRAAGAWLHVDAAFGAFAALVPSLAHLVAGLSEADSIAADGHKWLNVPYDAGFHFTRHPGIQERVFRVTAPYLAGPPMPAPDPLNRTPENSSRLRALATWMTLTAYGRAGHREIVERDCAFARALAAWVEASPDFTLMAPVRLNVVCFRLADRWLAGGEPAARHREFLAALRDGGETYLTPTMLFGVSGMRAAASNWRTRVEVDLPRVTRALERALEALGARD